MLSLILDLFSLSGVFMAIHHWPKDDRPREKLLIKGEHFLTDAELLAIFLQTGIRGSSPLDIAKELLQNFGSLKKLYTAPMHVLVQKKGLGAVKYVRLRAALELGKRLNNEVIQPGMILKDALMTQRFLRSHLRERTSEVFACIFLNNHYEMLAYEELFHGTINETSVYPREIVKKGLAHNAARVILAHNHPSGHPEPSHADIEITQIIKQALSFVDITVADHIIIGNPGNYSFVENGLLRV